MRQLITKKNKNFSYKILVSVKTSLNYHVLDLLKLPRSTESSLTWRAKYKSMEEVVTYTQIYIEPIDLIDTVLSGGGW